MRTLSRRAFLRGTVGAAVVACTPVDLAPQHEGRLALVTWGNRAYHSTIEAFERAFPGIVVDQLAESSADAWLTLARTKGRFDLALVQPDRALKDGAPTGMWAPLRPLLSRPDVVDEAAWRDGLDARFLDAGGELCFDWEYQVCHAYAVNTDLVGEGEIASVRDLLDPKWRGQIISTDPRIGLGLMAATAVRASHGDDVLKELLVDQRPVLGPGARDTAAKLIDGRFPIGLGLRPKALQPFRDQGLADKIKWLDLPDADFVPSTAMLYFAGAPHPATATLFANWFLGQEAQATLCRSYPTNSARLDVAPFELDCVGAPGQTYFEPDREASYASLAETQRLVRDLLS